MTEPPVQTRADKLAWCKERAAAEPWQVAVGSLIQDMELMDIPMSPAIMQLGMMEAVARGERGVREFIEGIK